MSLSSMTGFGRASGQTHGFHWTWEIRSVNARGLDIRVRVPASMERLEIPARQVAARSLVRGNIAATLTVLRDPGDESVFVKDGALDDLIALSQRLAEAGNLAPASVDGLLSVGGLVELRERQFDEDELEELDKALLAGLADALAALGESRLREGADLRNILEDQLRSIQELIGQAAASEAASLEAIRARFEEKVNQIMEKDRPIDDERLAQEVTLLAVKADVREELDRLRVHASAARALLEGKDAVGRQLEFLSQELIREANTVCAKSAEIELTNLGLALKSEIDRFREQAQNIE